MAGSRRFRWQVHEVTQRGWCRLAFVLLALLPLGGTVVFSGIQLLPNYQRWVAAGWSERISRQCGLEVEVAAVESPLPGTWILSGLRLTHPESRRAIGWMDSVRVTLEGGQRLIEVGRLQLQRDQLPAAWRILHAAFVQRPDRHGSTAHLSVEEVELRKAGAGPTERIRQVSIKHLPSKDALLLSLDFQVAHDNPLPSPDIDRGSASPSEAARLILKRYHQPQQMRTTIQLQSPMPWSLDWLAAVSGWPLEVGADAKIVGAIKFDQRASGWKLSMQDAELRELDFGALCKRTPVMLSAHGSLSVQRAMIEDSRLEEFYGSIVLGPGRIGADFLYLLEKHLGVQASDRNPVQVHAFDRGVFSMQVQPGSIQLVGRLDDGALFADTLGGLVLRPESKWSERIPITHIVALLEDGSSLTDSEKSTSPLARRAVAWLPLHAESLQR